MRSLQRPLYWDLPGITVYTKCNKVYTKCKKVYTKCNIISTF